MWYLCPLDILSMMAYLLKVFWMEAESPEHCFPFEWSLALGPRRVLEASGLFLDNKEIFMTSLQLKQAVRDRYIEETGRQVTQRQVDRLLEVFFQIFEERLSEGKRVPLGRICRLQQVWRKAKAYNNILTKGQVKKPPYISLACRVSTVMKRRMNPQLDK